jgi:flagella basal body P-ring formation protein FlgA
MTLLALLALALGVALTGPVPDAIKRSVRDRMGDVRVTVIEMSQATGDRRPAGLQSKTRPMARAQGPEPTLTAVPEAGSRLGRTIRFQLFAGGVRTGSVVAKLDVAGSVVRTRQALSRGDRVEAGNVELVDADLKDLLLKRQPSLEDVVGAEARRDIAAHEILTDALVLAPPTVQSGDEVRVSVTAGPVRVTGTGRASGSGRVGDLIRVLVPSSRRGLKARITGPGSVEIVR